MLVMTTKKFQMLPRGLQILANDAFRVSSFENFHGYNLNIKSLSISQHCGNKPNNPFMYSCFVTVASPPSGPTRSLDDDLEGREPSLTCVREYPCSLKASEQLQ